MTTLARITQGRCLRSRRVGPAVVHEVVYASGEFMPTHNHATANITLVVGGELDETIEGDPFHAGPLSVVFKPSTIEHSTRIGARGVRTFVVEIDAATERALRRRGVLASACRWTADSEVAASLTTLWALASGPDAPAADAVAAWLARLPSLVDAAARHDARRSALPPPGPLALALRSLEQHYDRPLGPADLAGLLQMHPSSVTRLFRKHLGHGVKSCLRRIRARHAADQLAQSNMPLIRVALLCGYADQAHLGREFRRVAGLTPGAYRRLARSVASPPV